MFQNTQRHPWKSQFDAKTLDSTLQKWHSATADKESAENVTDIVGTAFGQGLVDELNCEWKLITDQYGTDITVIHKKYVINAFPYSSVQKIMTEEENPRLLADIRLMLKNQIENADKIGNVDLKK